MGRELGEPVGQFAYEVSLEANEIHLLDGSRHGERRTLPNSGALVDGGKCDRLIQLLILQLDQSALGLPSLVVERIRRRPRSCGYMARGSQ
ncbi:hypothetical protein A5696_01685 [Mycobacterium sp. E2699]|nr:hypothetical protein A5696_01685 [Mycobacterium sp. E2699]